MTPLGTVDDFAGALLGIVKSGFALSLILLLISYLELPVINSFLSESVVLPFVQPIAPTILHWFSGFYPTLKEFLQPDSIPGEPLQV